jgi:4-alpha-glucanotransferase
VSSPGRPEHARALARLFGIQTWYLDFAGQRQYASTDALLATARALGAELGSDADADEAVRARRAHLAAIGVEPVHVAWNGRLRSIELRDAAAAGQPLQLHMRLESGETRSWRVKAEVAGSRGMEVVPACFRIPLDAELPIGYHTLEIESAAATFETLIIAAPRHASVEAGRSWGVFAPVYALCSARSSGIGDFTDLETLGAWAGGLGASFVSTLPLLATFLTSPFDPSPYSPASRLFWNEVFLDLDAAARDVAFRDDARIASPPEERAACTPGDLVDYRSVAAAKRKRIAALAGDFFARAGSRSPDFGRFVGAHPDVEAYARFRAVGERQRAGWPAWPDRLRTGDIRPGDYDDEDAACHLFAQYEADRQLAGVAARLREQGVRLYLDLPLGVHADSYDVWRNRELFALGASAGAPPDALFSGGQSWGFPPLKPESLRRNGYRYLIDCVRHHLRHAGMLRLDHVMALRRLYWIPPEFSAREGIYVRYPADEWLAVLTLESQRHRAMIIGEDLGTVPREVRQAMDRHKLQRMYVVQFEANASADPPIPPVPESVIASLNTHDMPPFAAYWSALDVEDQRDLGLTDETGVADRRRGRAMTRAGIVRHLGLPPEAARPDGAGPALQGILEHLAASDARALLVGLEDLWLETKPQNVPGTSSERPNWQRRLRLGLEALIRDPNVAATLQAVARRRNGRE